MRADGIRRVTEALKECLEQALRFANMPGTVFVGPLDDPDVHDAALILFLYRVVPNASLRNREHRVYQAPVNPPQADPKVQVFQNALPLDLYFLITVGTKLGSEETPLHSLGIAIQALHAASDLTVTGAEQETVRITLEPLTTEEASRIWALFPTANYRTSVAYLATPVWIDPRLPEPVAAPVVQDQLLSGHRVEVSS